jgi:DNA-binding beta-propeller fold protein YncE
MKTIEFLVGRKHTSPRSRRATRVGVGPSLLKYLLLASLVIPVEPLLLASAGIAAVGGTPAFQAPSVDQFGGVQRPGRIAVSSDGDVYVSDSPRGAVAIFDTAGQRVGTLSGFDQPLGLAVSEFNRCVAFGTCNCRRIETAYVGDQSNGSVSVFENGRLVRQLGAGPGEFIKPGGIAVTADQVSYVVDSEARNIKSYARDGTLLATFGSRGWENGQVEYPVDVALDKATGELFVADYGNRRIAVFDLDGAWLRNVWAPLNDQGGYAFFRIAGIGIGPNGNLYVVDSALSSVTIMTPAGALIDIIGYDLGSYWTGDLNVPIDAATDGSFLYVTSSSDHLVKVFGETP